MLPLPNDKVIYQCDTFIYDDVDRICLRDTYINN